MSISKLCGLIFLIVFIAIIVFLVAGDIWWCICNNKQRNLNNIGDTQTIITTDRIGRKGELGNQLFQLSTAYVAAKENGCKNVMNDAIKCLPLWSIFSESLQENQKPLEYDIGTVEGERSKWRQLVPYEPVKVPSKGHIIDMNGLFEDMRYFDKYKHDLKIMFKPNDELLKAVKAILPEKYIAIHIRNTDNIPWHNGIPIIGFTSSRYPVSFEYYRKGIEYLQSELGKLPVYICTDNSQWVTENIHLIHDDAQLMPIIDQYRPISTDFCALYLATGAVIWASTFSWWTSYLGDNELVVRPYPIWLPGTDINVTLGINGEYQHHSKMIELDYKSGEMVDMKDNPDDHKVLSGWAGYILSR
jgi:hypothetical protein